ncbi:MAG TPA: hypothetical protein VGI70_21865, partial [Polyangiales bacterium]
MSKHVRARVWVSSVAWLIGAHLIGCKSDAPRADTAVAGQGGSAGSSAADGGRAGMLAAADGGGGGASVAGAGGGPSAAGADGGANSGTGSAIGDATSLSAIIALHAVPGGGED